MSRQRNFQFNGHFSLRNDHFFCEDVSIKELQASLKENNVTSFSPSPVFVYSRNAIVKNIKSYHKALSELGNPYILGYAMKANFNPGIVSIMKEEGCSAVTVSGNEIRLALMAGMDPCNIITNGNGKCQWELELGIKNNCIITVDSTFDVCHLVDTAEKLGKICRILVRVNPDIDPAVHPYLATGMASSKFGVFHVHLEGVLAKILKEPNLKLVGLHCHLGSTITDVKAFSESAMFMVDLMHQVKAKGFSHLQYLNLGGGLGIDYEKHANRTSPNNIDDRTEYPMPTPIELVSVLKDKLAGSGWTLILEPGRSLIADTSVLACKVIGCKRNDEAEYIVIDGSMTEVIRPALYSSYHHIELTEPTKFSETKRRNYDVVGPVCECADFLGKQRLLPKPHEGCGIAVFDVGAYCGSMSSNYNMRGRPAEVLVSGDSWSIIRKPDSISDILRPYRASQQTSS